MVFGGRNRVVSFDDGVNVMKARPIAIARGLDVMNVKQLAKMFELPKYEKVEEANCDYTGEAYSGAYEEALKKGMAQDQVEEVAMIAEAEATPEVYGGPSPARIYEAAWR